MIYLNILFLLASLFPFFVYPPALRFLSRFFRPLSRPESGEYFPFVSLVIPVRNGENLIVPKLRNALQLHYPPDRLEVIVISDGSTDSTVAQASKISDSRISIHVLSEHKGKNFAINFAVKKAIGDILLFSDVDALLEAKSLENMVPWFRLPEIGGVCGRKRIKTARDSLEQSQVAYNSYEEKQKLYESRIHSTVTNEGKIHAIRKSLFRPLPHRGMDDLLNLLCIVKQGKRFVFEPQAIAFIPSPSRKTREEFIRRKRIVRGSFLAMWHHKSVFNPLQSGMYAPLVWVHKLGRRLASIFLVFTFVSTLLLSSKSLVFKTLLFIQLAGILATTGNKFLRLPAGKKIPKVSGYLNLAYYFILGNIGTLAGIIETLLIGKYTEKWTPLKRDALHDASANNLNEVSRSVNGNA
ncbi:MAG: glycosyltransferase [Chitinivibrionales bacterium]|nr:glycosyltransferase [Chitinivibrionales bacterium]